MQDTLGQPSPALWGETQVVVPSRSGSSVVKHHIELLLKLRKTGKKLKMKKQETRSIKHATGLLPLPMAMQSRPVAVDKEVDLVID